MVVRLVALHETVSFNWNSWPSTTASLSAKEGSSSSPGEYLGKRTISFALRTIGGRSLVACSFRSALRISSAFGHSAPLTDVSTRCTSLSSFD